MTCESQLPPIGRASIKGVQVNRANAWAHAETILRVIANLRACGIVTQSALADELHRLGYRGRRGGRINRKRIAEMRERLQTLQEMRKA